MKCFPYPVCVDIVARMRKQGKDARLFFGQQLWQRHRLPGLVPEIQTDFTSPRITRGAVAVSRKHRLHPCPFQGRADASEGIRLVLAP